MSINSAQAEADCVCVCVIVTAAQHVLARQITSWCHRRNDGIPGNQSLRVTRSSGRKGATDQETGSTEARASSPQVQKRSKSGAYTTSQTTRAHKKTTTIEPKHVRNRDTLDEGTPLQQLECAQTHPPDVRKLRARKGERPRMMRKSTTTEIGHLRKRESVKAKLSG
jgi:hypothetical protein